MMSNVGIFTSVIEPDAIINIVEKTMEPTQEMQAKDTDIEMPLTYRDVISRLIERNVEAWKALPLSVRDALLGRPADFHLSHPIPHYAVPDIIYNGVVMRYTIIGNSEAWIIHNITQSNAPSF